MCIIFKPMKNGDERVKKRKDSESGRSAQVVGK